MAQYKVEVKMNKKNKYDLFIDEEFFYRINGSIRNSFVDDKFIKMFLKVFHPFAEVKNFNEFDQLLIDNYLVK